MEYVWFSVVGIIGGLLGGMGMGGGTLLIPLLTIFCKVGQHTAQAVNLLSFIVMALIVLVIHIRNKLVNFKKVLYIIVPGIATCIGGAYLAKVLSGDLLQRLFGGFLLILSIFQFISGLKTKKQ
ncbi:MAG: sulfite exporter TauE/SafE family protein [Clostridiales bacterium]|nr:sulfite exporter TauE/SafE family protein [Clostridiales bacterium]